MSPSRRIRTVSPPHLIRTITSSRRIITFKHEFVTVIVQFQVTIATKYRPLARRVCLPVILRIEYHKQTIGVLSVYRVYYVNVDYVLMRVF
jgi:hypothetical protein